MSSSVDTTLVATGNHGLKVNDRIFSYRLMTTNMRMAKDPDKFETNIVVSLNLVIPNKLIVLGRNVNAMTQTGSKAFWVFNIDDFTSMIGINKKQSR